MQDIDIFVFYFDCYCAKITILKAGFSKEDLMMFGKGKKVESLENNDYELMMAAMDAVISGNYADCDTSQFADPKHGEKINEMIHAFKRANNNFVMRMNEAMESIGDNSYVKQTLDQVQSQSDSIAQMEAASQNMAASISTITSSMGVIRDNAHDMLAVAEKSTSNMSDSIQVVNESSETIIGINQRIQEFQEKIDRISEIVDMVKKVASQSNLLALNASIEAARAGEAGRGFAVVADQVRELSSNTSSSAEDIVNYVAELRTDIKDLAETMDITTQKLGEGNAKVETSLKDVEKMTSAMTAIRDSVDEIFTDMDEQANVTMEFSKQVENISGSYDELNKYCMEQGVHVYKIGRYIDTARSDMVRGFAEVTVQDWLRIFEIDHFILMWRVYNNAVGFEQLKITQLNNYDKCKLGLWLGRQTEPEVVNSKEFATLKQTHYEVHKYATESWKAKDEGDVKKALDYFQKTYDAYFVYKRAIQDMQKKFEQLGYTDRTEIVVFRR